MNGHRKNSIQWRIFEQITFKFISLITCYNGWFLVPHALITLDTNNALIDLTYGINGIRTSSGPCNDCMSVFMIHARLYQIRISGYYALSSLCYLSVRYSCIPWSIILTRTRGVVFSDSENGGVRSGIIIWSNLVNAVTVDWYNKRKKEKYSCNPLILKIANYKFLWKWLTFVRLL